MKNITENTRTNHHYLVSGVTRGSRWKSICEQIRFIWAHLGCGLSSHALMVFLCALLLSGCKPDNAITERELTEARFEEELGCKISAAQWWETSVKLQIQVETDEPVQLWLSSAQQNALLYDYKEIQASGTVTMTAPQGQSRTLYLSYCGSNHRIQTQTVTLTGAPVETISLDAKRSDVKQSMPVISPIVHYQEQDRSHPASLCGPSVAGNAEYRQLTDEQLISYFNTVEIFHSVNNYIEVHSLVDDYELLSHGPFYITWVSGYEASQNSRILGYYYHSPETYDDIEYVDLSETHRWDYIDGLSKVQYQISIEEDVAGMHFSPGHWYDANFDQKDDFGSTSSDNMDRIGDSAFNMYKVYRHYYRNISAMRGISFLVDVPEGKCVGFYLRSETESFPDQWNRLKEKGVRPYVDNSALFRGTCFSNKGFNVDGKRRSVLRQDGSVIWMGMEDIVTGGDNDCNDVLFSVTEDAEIYEPEIIDPEVITVDYDGLLPWTLAFEDVYRDADFDFNDAVIKLVPDYERELCCVTAMAVGSTERVYLYYDGPNGEVNLGELHELFGNTTTLRHINTEQPMITSPVVPVECVPWPKNYTMEQDARRFSVRVQRGTCEDCTDTLSLPTVPGELPEALLVAGEWKWPMENRSIISAYTYFPYWSQNPSNIPYWDWYKNGIMGTYVSY